MAAISQTTNLEINGTPQQCYEAICDFESYPEWQESISSAKILKKDKKGRVKHVEYVLKAVIKDIRYVLEYTYEEKDKDKLILKWSFVEGDVNNIEGSFIFENIGENKALATYSLLVDPGMWIPGPILKTLSNVTMKACVKDLKKRVEGG